MKINTFKTLLGSLTIAGALVALPLSAYALDASSTSALQIGENGVVHVRNAEVTSVSGSIINAVTRFKDTLATWAFTTNASTTVRLGNKATSTAQIQAGDKISVLGFLTSFGSTFGVNATKIRGLTSIAAFRGTTGTVKSINLANATFVTTVNGKDITIATNASTTFAMAGTSTVASLAKIAIGQKVTVLGTLNADKTILTAVKVTIKHPKEDRNENEGSSHGLKNGQKDKEDRDNSGEHKGFLQVNSNLNLNLGNRGEDESGREDR